VQFACLLALLSFMVSYLTIPKLIGIAGYKNLMDKPNSRSSHQKTTPTLGGIAFFVSLVLCLFFLQYYDDAAIGMNLIVALTILFMTGIKDDLMVLGPKAKIGAQLLAFTFLLANTELHIMNWHGFLGFTTVPLWINIVLSYMAMLAIINAYNLIDGIDGLASLLGIAIFAVFGMVFYSLALYFYFLLAVVAIAFLIAFFRYNISKKQKIFMGDTGSMIVGFLIGMFTLRFLALSPESLTAIQINPANLLLLVLAILFIPLLDVFRVVMIRLLHKKGPFTPDRNHVHHIFIDLGWSHIHTSIFLTAYSLVIAGLFFMINMFVSTNTVLFMLFVMGIFNLVLIFHVNPNYNALRQKVRFKATFMNSMSIPKLQMRSMAIGFFRIFF
jgi:UDP-N-acetylmuramyl pentapeptide phosphotransferase/UDP-N-acetylglucosamine-1-phosphate transferase